MDVDENHRPGVGHRVWVAPPFGSCVDGRDVEVHQKRPKEVIDLIETDGPLDNIF